MSGGLSPGCFACTQQTQPDLAPREDIVHTGHWRVAHAFNSTLPGWLVVVPTRHVTSYAELAPAAADELGGLLLRLSLALAEVTGCVKTYQMQFSEAEGFSHLHVHVVPRLADEPADRRGPAAFRLPHRRPVPVAAGPGARRPRAATPRGRQRLSNGTANRPASSSALTPCVLSSRTPSGAISKDARSV